VSTSHRHRVLQLFEEHTASLRRFFRRRAPNPSDALDLTQEVYVRLLQAGEGREIRDVQAYLFTVARNLAAEHALLARRGHSRQANLADPAVQAQVEEQLAVLPATDADINRDQLLARLQQVMTRLPTRSQHVLRMVYFEGLSQARIGQRLGLSKTMIRLIHEEALEYCWKQMKRGDRT
jgi:RNA polymerase sigma factor (sigma-70 family)